MTTQQKISPEDITATQAHKLPPIQITPEEMNEVKEWLFPPLYRGLINLIGINEVYHLVNDYGGISIRIPKKVNTNSKIFRLVSYESATKLIKAFPETTLQLPKPDKILAQVRNKRIIRDSEAGYPKSTLAIMYGLSRRSIITICNAGTI